MIHLLIDGVSIGAKKGDNLLYTALTNGVYIPNLCFVLEREKPYGACRLCYVEIEGKHEPVLSCATTVEEGMKVVTNGEKARRLQVAAFELIMSTHRLACATCGKRMACELQKIAKHLKVKLGTKRLRKIEGGGIDNSHPRFIFDQGKCVLCGKCVWLCEEKKGMGVISFVGRGIERRVSTFMDRPLAEYCLDCSDCVDICPTGAFSFKKEKEEDLWS